MMQHLTWSIETNDKCPQCAGEVVIVTPGATWRTHESEDDEGALIAREATADVGEDISGHYCQRCGILTSLSLNA